MTGQKRNILNHGRKNGKESNRTGYSLMEKKSKFINHIDSLLDNAIDTETTNFVYHFHYRLPDGYYLATETTERIIHIVEFQRVLSGLKNRMEQDYHFAKNVYRALCNVKWIKKEGNNNHIFVCSWRYAARFVAETRGIGEHYTQFYCSNNEGNVIPEIKSYMEQNGWVYGLVSKGFVWIKK